MLKYVSQIYEAIAPYKDKVIVCLETAADYVGLSCGLLEPEHAWSKFKGVENKPVFGDMCDAVLYFIRQFIDWVKDDLVWNGYGGLSAIEKASQFRL